MYEWRAACTEFAQGHVRSSSGPPCLPLPMDGGGGCRGMGCQAAGAPLPAARIQDLHRRRTSSCRYGESWHLPGKLAADPLSNRASGGLCRNQLAGGKDARGQKYRSRRGRQAAADACFCRHGGRQQLETETADGHDDSALAVERQHRPSCAQQLSCDPSLAAQSSLSAAATRAHPPSQLQLPPSLCCSDFVQAAPSSASTAAPAALSCSRQCTSRKAAPGICAAPLSVAPLSVAVAGAQAAQQLQAAAAASPL